MDLFDEVDDRLRYAPVDRGEQMKEWYPELVRYFDAFDPDDSVTFAPPEEDGADIPDMSRPAVIKRSSLLIPVAIILALALVVYYVFESISKIPAAG